MTILLHEHAGKVAYCQKCTVAIQHNQFCDYCYQVYHIEDGVDGDDGLQWIECEICNKWVSPFSIKEKFIAKY
jgi:hypothetical protein